MAELIFISKWVLEPSAPNGKPRKTPKYILQKYMGDSPILSKRGKDGLPFLYYKPNRSIKPDAPAINLQGKDSINITGLRFLSKDGWKVGESVAYGEGSILHTFDNGTENYMYGHRADAYIFKFGNYVPYDFAEAECIYKVPSTIYWLIIADERLRAKQYAKAMQTGLFHEELAELENRGVLYQGYTK